MKNLMIIGLLFGSVTLGLSKGDNSLVHNLYQPQEEMKLIENEIDFWEEKIKMNPTQIYYQKLGSSIMSLYAVNGNIEDLIRAQECYEIAISKHAPGSSSIYRSLAHIKIKQHQFCDALEELLKAEEMGDDLSLTYAMMFDVYFELGNEEQILQFLNRMKKDGGFEYLIRLARWNDSEGRLSDAIHNLELAKELISEKDHKKMAWIHSNLADFYGHDGQIDKAFEYYKKALQFNRSDWYSLKGLAWVYFSDNRDSEYALQLLETIAQRYYIPSVEYMKYEIYKFQSKNDMALQVKLKLIHYLDKVEYYSSYSSMLFDLMIGKENYNDKLENILHVEKQYRESPEYYARYAQLLLSNKQFEPAKRVAFENVLDQTFEPDALRRILKLIREDRQLYVSLKNELMEAKFELGPNKYLELLQS